MAKREHKPATHTQETKDKISKSLLNNSNAEYWTRDLVISTLDEMIELLNTPYEVTQKTKEENNHLGLVVKEDKVWRKPHLKSTLIIHFKIWYVDWFGDMAQKFSEDTTVYRMLKAIDMICEQNAYEDATNNATNPMMTKSLLSRHYGWVDKSETTSKDVTLTTEELEARAREYEKRNGNNKT